jgi:phage-related protein
MTWQIDLIQEAERELRAMPPEIIARFARVVDLVVEHGPRQVGMPHIRHLEDKLWEMRLTGRDGIARAVYVARTGQRLIVLHVFIKKTQKTPRAALALARARLRSLTDDDDCL